MTTIFIWISVMLFPPHIRTLMERGFQLTTVLHPGSTMVRMRIQMNSFRRKVIKALSWS